MSDSAAVCPHCGERLLPESGESANTEAVEPKKQFDKLTNQEKNALREEFYRLYPDFRIPERKEKRLGKFIRIGWIICGVLAIALCALFLFLPEDKKSSLGLGLMIGLPLGVLVLAITVRVLIFFCYTMRTLVWQYRAVYKKFNFWLEEEKNIVGERMTFCDPKAKDFSAKEKARYDALDPDEEVKKWRS